MNWVEEMFAEGFMPHGHCYRWTAGILWGHAGADVLIALAYFSIPLALGVLVRRRSDLEFGRTVLLFALFILACGLGHLLDVWNIWHGQYGLSAVVRVVTAVVSVGTALSVWPLLPRALAVPSVAALEQEVAERRRAESKLESAHNHLEQRVVERTQELENFAQLAADREDRMIELKQQVNALCTELGRPPVHDLSFLAASEPQGSKGNG